MPISITMPRLSDTMEAGTIIKWNVKEGDKVSAGDVVADVETDKATMEMSVYDDGTVAKIAVPEGKSVSVGTVIAVLAEQGEDVKAAATETGKSQPSDRRAASEPPRRQDRSSSAGQTAPAETRGPDRDQPEAESSSDAEPGPDPRGKRAQAKLAESAPPDQDRRDEPDDDRGPVRQAGRDVARVRVSPVARRLADEHEIDLRGIEGSGPGGRIIKRDVMDAIDAAEETAAAVPPAAKPQTEPPETRLATRVQKAAASPSLAQPGLESRSIALSSMRQTIARRLVESKTTIPHYQVSCTFSMDALLDLRSTLNEQLEAGGQGVKLSINDFLVKACAVAMYRHPEFNASWAEDHIEVHGEVNIGIAISVPAERGGGLVVGVIRNADQKGLRVISYESRMLAEKARTRGLSIQEMSDSTFTLSNLGMYGVDNFTAIINPPNVAIIAVGAALKKPVVRDGQLAIGQEMSATLSCDHRVIDGAMAAEYLQALRELIENPATLMV